MNKLFTAKHFLLLLVVSITIAHCAKKQEEIKTNITINKGYRLTKGRKYTIQYCANNVSYLDKQNLMELWSNKVEIDYI